MVNRIDSRNRYDLVYQEIKENIINNNLKPGEKLNVQTLSEQLGVSRTPVSNAMQALERDGYVVILPQNGTYVRELTKDELSVLYRVREEIEKLALELVANRIDHNKLEDFRENFQKIKESDREYEQILKEYFDLEMDFHDYIMSGCPDIIRKETQNIIDLTKRSRKLCARYEIEQNIKEKNISDDIDVHVQIIDSMLEGDIEKAKLFVEKDIRESTSYLFKIMDLDNQ